MENSKKVSVDVEQSFREVLERQVSHGPVTLTKHSESISDSCSNILMYFRLPFFRYWNRSNIRLWLFGENLNKSPRPLKVSPPRIPAFAARRDLSNDSSREKVWQLIKVMTAKRVKSGSSYDPR
jgi:hypothetical protein